MTNSVFAVKRRNTYTPFTADLVVERIVGGTPSDPKVAEGWIKKNLGADNQDLINEMVAKTMIERGIEMADAADEVANTIKLNGFKQDEQGLYIEGRQAKSAIREAANVVWPKRTWGPSRKGTKSFWVEHVFVEETRIHLGVMEPDGVQQRFVQTWRGTGIQYEEYVDGAALTFTVITDVPNEISTDDWAEMWVRAENLGIGATRSQGFGRYAVTKWEKAA